MVSMTLNIIFKSDEITCFKKKKLPVALQLKENSPGSDASVFHTLSTSAPVCKLDPILMCIDKTSCRSICLPFQDTWSLHLFKGPLQPACLASAISVSGPFHGNNRELKAVCHAFDWVTGTIQRIGNLNGC